MYEEFTNFFDFSFTDQHSQSEVCEQINWMVYCSLTEMGGTQKVTQSPIASEVVGGELT